MWLIVGAAVLGAFLGLSSRHRIVMAVVTAALAMVAHFAMAFWDARGGEGGVNVAHIFAESAGADGLNGYVAMLAGASACLIAGLLVSQVEKAQSAEVYIPRDGDFRASADARRALNAGGRTQASAREARLKALLER